MLEWFRAPLALKLSTQIGWAPGYKARPLAGVEEEGAAPCPAQVSSPGAGFGNQAAGEIPGCIGGRVAFEGPQPKRVRD